MLTWSSNLRQSRYRVWSKVSIIFILLLFITVFLSYSGIRIHFQTQLPTNKRIGGAHMDDVSIIWMKQASTCPSLNLSIPQPDSCESNHDLQQLCMNWREKHHIRLNWGWGTLPRDLRHNFTSLGCDKLISLRLVANYVLQHPYLVTHPWEPTEQFLFGTRDKKSGDRDNLAVSSFGNVSLSDSATKRPVVAVVVYLTVHTCSISEPEDLFFISQFLPSFFQSLEADFEYWLILTFFSEDPWLSQPHNLNLLRVAFEKKRDAFPSNTEVKLLLSHSNHSSGSGRRLSIDSVKKYNQAVATAYTNGATWIYCIQDNVSFDSKWASSLTRALTNLGPLYGVVSPDSDRHQTDYLPAYFTHRTHIDLFKSFFPYSLHTKEWFERWMSTVYGPQRTAIVQEALIKFHPPCCLTEFGWDEFRDPEYLYGEVARGHFVLDFYQSRLLATAGTILLPTLSVQNVSFHSSGSMLSPAAGQ